MRARKKLGEILVEGGLLTQKQLEEALPFQKKSNLKLGQFLVREGIVSESQIVDLVSNQLRLEQYRPDKYTLDVDLANLLPPDIAHKYQAAPLQKSGLLLTIAMMDPLDINALDAIEVYTNCEVEAIICTEQHLNQLLNSLYGSYAGIGGVLEDMEEMEIDKTAEKSPVTEDVEVSSLQGMAEEAPVVRLVNSILSQGVREGASDIHVSPEKDSVQVRFRVDGRLHEVPAPPKSMFLPIISRLKILANMDIAVSRIPQDGRFTVKMKNKDINIRASTIPSIYGENMVLRLLDTSNSIYSLERLGMNEKDRQKLEQMISKPYGMILSTGPTGSGKSTSLYSILKKINQPDINIITVEDPVEYRIEKIRQVQLNRKAGMTFASGLRSILRQDPDVIMVGEIRDLETAEIAIKAAQTGHLVLSTLHTNDAPKTLTRMVDMGVMPYAIATSVSLIIAQRLARRLCDNCKEVRDIPREALEKEGYTAEELDEGITIFGRSDKGCKQCNDGYKGRVGIFQVMEVSEVMGRIIMEGGNAMQIAEQAAKEGVIDLRRAGLNKVKDGITSLEEVNRVTIE